MNTNKGGISFHRKQSSRSREMDGVRQRQRQRQRVMWSSDTETPKQINKHPTQPAERRRE